MVPCWFVKGQGRSLAFDMPFARLAYEPIRQGDKLDILVDFLFESSDQVGLLMQHNYA
jgi:hypothetical protein